MELKFHHALIVVGAVLLCLGAVSEVLYVASVDSRAASFAEMFSAGFSTMLFSLFAGVLIGVGISLAADGALLRIHGKSRRHWSLLLLALLSAALAALAASIGTHEHQLISVLLFFAFLSSFIAFLFSFIVMAMSEFFGIRAR
jgi:hypothetical protein